ncbi:MAG TPA: redoxin domain-containing protein [Solirubrobacteraceae bacterium]|nr:redoxin domain-containing protein [Solirubrobacteraceae bacterium]
MRAPVDHIPAPPFPRQARWINVATLRMDQQRGHPVLIEFWDFCRPNSIRTLPYLTAWDRRYRDRGLRIVGVHSPGFPPSADGDNVAAAVARLGIEYPVLVDSEHELWTEYENLGWPARYLFNQDGRLFDYHYGEGAYEETERAICELLDVDDEPLAPLRPEDEPGALLVAQTDDVPGPYDGPYEAGAVWGVFDGCGTVTVNGADILVDHPGAYELLRHEVSTAGTLAMTIGDGVVCHATCFTPGVAP